MAAPTLGPAEAIGTPTAGCLRGGDALPLRGEGFKLVRPERRRHFGHPELTGLIRSLKIALVQSGEHPLLVGDLGLARGGPTLSAHSSHQTGLDADIWYWRTPRASKSSKSLTPPSMIDRRRLEAGRAFGPAEISLLKRFASKEKVDRILVHFALKRELCRKFPTEPWIRKVRPWFGHDRHFHIRLRCPEGSPACRNGEPIPEGNGCDATLDWWWSEEARSDEGKNLYRQQNPILPELPAACGALIYNI